jgi:hypothetical protein
MQPTFFAVIEIVGLHRELWEARVPAPILQLGSHHWPFCVRTPSGHNQRALGNRGASARSAARFALGPTAPAWRCLLGIKGVGSIRPINAALARTPPESSCPHYVRKHVVGWRYRKAVRTRCKRQLTVVPKGKSVMAEPENEQARPCHSWSDPSHADGHQTAGQNSHTV